jgi:hypothetical protein
MRFQTTGDEMAHYFSAREAKRIALDKMGHLESALTRIQAEAEAGRLECVFGSVSIPANAAEQLRELGFVVQPEGRTTHVSWK